MKFLPYYFFVFTFFLLGCKPSVKDIKSKLSKADTASAQNYLNKLGELLKKDPKNPEIYYLRAQVFLNNHQAKNAISDLNAAIALNAKKAEYYILLSDAYFSMVQTRMAKESLEKSLVIDPENIQARMKLAELYLYVQQYKESMEYLNQVLIKDIRNTKAYFIKGINYLETEDTTKAISSFQTVIEQDPEYYSAYMQLGIIYFHKKNDLALQYLNSALNLDPKSEEALYARAMYFQQAGDSSNAIKDYNTIITLNSCNPYANYNKGYIYLSIYKQVEKALPYFEKAIACDTNYLNAYKKALECYQILGNKQKAKETETKIKELNSVLNANS